MTYRDWLPTFWNEQKEDDGSAFLDLRKRIDSLFEDFDRGLAAAQGAIVVRSNVSETDKEIRITAELPGITKDDLDVSVTGNQITLKGEKKSEKEEKGEEKGREFHRMERTSGAFQRSMTLPYEIDADSVKAKCKDGVVTVTIPKPPELIEKTRKIEVHDGN